MTDLFAGIDAGGTSTRVAVASADGSILAWGHGPGGNPNHVGWDGVDRAINHALDDAGVSREAIRSLFLGMAGVISSADRKKAAALADGWGLSPGCKVAADHDIRIALEGGLAGRPGIALIAGTGSSCYGRNSRGEAWQAGGWEATIDDLGSGYDVARRGMAMAAQSADGRIPTSLLEQLFFEALEVGNVVEFSARVHRPPLPRHEIAALAPLVLAAADKGDGAARCAMVEAAGELVRMVQAVAARLFDGESVEIVLLGGLLDRAALYREQVERSLRDALPDIRIARARYRPAIGALSIAARDAGFVVPDNVLEALSRKARL